MEDIQHYEIPVFNFPFEEEYDDDEVIAENTELRVSFMMFIKNIINHSIIEQFVGDVTICHSCFGRGC